VYWLKAKKGKVPHTPLIVHPLSGQRLELRLPATCRDADAWAAELDRVWKNLRFFRAKSRKKRSRLPRSGCPAA